MSDDSDDLIDENRRRLAAVTLRAGTQNGVWSRLSAHIAADGSLVISGHDLGPRASMLGDELEFWIKVEERYLERLADVLANVVGSDERTAKVSRCHPMPVTLHDQDHAILAFGH